MKKIDAMQPQRGTATQLITYNELFALQPLLVWVNAYHQETYKKVKARPLLSSRGDYDYCQVPGTWQVSPF